MSHYSIWMLEYAYIPECPMSSLVYGRHNQGTVKLPYGYVLLKGQGTTILVDCGYNHDAYGKHLAEFYGVHNWHAPAEVLAECEITPEEIQHVIITHAHFDHMGGLRFFPNAKFYLQERELSQWAWTMALPRQFRWMMSAADPADIMYAAELAEAGRLVSVKGDSEDILPGIDLRLAADSHTAGSQFVVIRNDGNRNSQDAYVCAGDLVYRHENLHGGTPDDPMYVPVGLAVGSQTNLLMTSQAIMDAVQHDYKRVLAAHEENMPNIYPSRKTNLGLCITEIALAKGEKSLVAN
ncbi:N-acyl homoserine lactonase family protein [Burkholderia cepacia]|uniref:N-acyl homoserine lactonase family protein n=1 Tax=Burkholderia cepacia TaxID=292 RepID=UPI00298F8504|nr:N-acyl homoserine lactonase family protein [Burkholderia cepacia]MDW9248549.1 metallo-beta-lactamase superfamily protein [Burkholderia cepacia]